MLIFHQHDVYANEHKPRFLIDGTSFLTRFFTQSFTFFSVKHLINFSVCFLLLSWLVSPVQGQGQLIAPQQYKPHQHTKHKHGHHCSRAHFHHQQKLDKLKKQAQKARISVANKQLNGRKATSSKPSFVQTIAPMAPSSVNATQATCQYTIGQIAYLNSADLINFLTSTTDYECVGTPLFGAQGYLSLLFSNQKMEAVFREVYNRSASYNGTMNSGMYGLMIYMHTAIYHEFFSPTQVTLDNNSKYWYGLALESLSNNANLFNVNGEALPILQEYIVNLDYDGVRHKASTFNVLKQVMRNLTVNDNWKQITDSQVLRSYAAAYNGIFFLMFRGSGTEQGGDSDFWNSVDNDTEFTSLLGSIGKDTELAANDDLAFMVNNAVLELTRMAHIPGVISQIEADLAAIVNQYPRLEIKWFRSVIALNKYGNCAPYGLCENEDALKEELNQYLFPNNFTFDDGKLVVKTPLPYNEVQELYHAAKEVQAQFFKMLQTDQPVAGDVNETLNMVVFGSKSQYEDYAPYLYNISTNNGGIYIERRSTFYTWDRTVGVESSLSLEALFRHEYCHYLQGRYLIQGYWGENPIYNNSRMVWYEEGMAEFFAGATATDGLKMLASNVGVVRNAGGNWPTLSTVFNSSYTSGNFHHYHYGNMAWYNWYINDFGTLKTFFDLTRNNDVAGFDNLVTQLRSSGQTQYQNFLTQVNNGSLNGKEPSTAWLNDIQFNLGNTNDIKTEFVNVTGISNVTAGIEANLINKRYKITGTLTGQGTSNNNATAAQSTGEALNQILKNLRNNSNINNLDYSLGYLTNITFSGGTPTADFVITGPLRNPNVSDDAVANFNVTSRAVLVGNAVQFNDKSTGQLSAWNWSFVGGTPATSNLPNPSITYNNAGTYDVSLTASSQNGTNNTDARNQYLKVYAKSNASYCVPTVAADFTFIRRVQIANIDNTTEGFPTSTNGYSDYSAQLTELTQGQSYQLIVTPDYTNSDNIGVGAWIDWNQDGDFDDAGEEVLMKKGRFGTAEATIQVPANTTLNIATRLRIRLNYRDENPQACGADSYMGEVEDYSIVVINGSIAGQAPTVVISSNINYTIRNGAINFENQSTGNPTSIVWEFAGGNPATSTANNPTVTYANDGIFPVTLTASNANGRDKTIAYVTVKKGGGVDGEYCTTSNSRDDVHINNVTLGSINNNSGFSNNGYGDFTSISTVLARNTAHALSVSTTQAWSLNTVRVWIDWNQDGDFNDDGERVLDASGDGTPYASSFNVPVSAKEGGTRMRVRLAYSVEAQSCGEGSIGEVEDYIVYVGQVTPTADFSVDKTIITAGESVSFTNTSAGNPTTFAWTFAGGSPTNSTAQNPVVTYNTPGVYEVSLTVGDGQTTNTKTVSSLITVNPAPVIPVADFSANVTTIEVGQSVTFTDLSSNEPTSWNWTFAGGAPASSTVQTPTVTYNTPGVYEVSLTVTNTAGSNTKTVSAFINVAAPNCTYCGASASNSTYEYIDQVQLGSFSYTSGNNGGYSDNTGQTIQVTSGQNYTVNLTPGFSGASYNETFRVWIDYNKDCDFDDAGELVFEGSGSSLVSGSVTIQAGLSNLNTQMRVAMQYNGAPASCGSFTYGEVEDYAIQIQEGDIVTPPTTSYCAASAQNTGSEHITRVQMGSIDNGTTSSGYGDYTGLSTSIVQGGSQNITVTPSVSWSLSKLSIWVDWNQDGDFDDVGESTVINGAGPYATTLGAPANAAIGSTRMRIRLSYGNAVSTACGDGWTGEVEDYTIQVTSGVSARTSSNLGTVRDMLQVFPNPAIQAKVMVSLPHRALLEREANAQISITDLNGKTVKSLTTDRSQTEVKLNDLPKGLYVIQVSLQGQTYTKRLMIK